MLKLQPFEQGKFFQKSNSNDFDHYLFFAIKQ